jgi:glutathione-specific gamma-glutamylcyclotransferase
MMIRLMRLLLSAATLPVTRPACSSHSGSLSAVWGGKEAAMPNCWVFGYGSLIWNPGFDFVRSETALLRGAHRSLSVYSHRHRGTPQRPGLVFGLSRGGSCRGVAFEVHSARWDGVFAYLQAREQDRGVYREAWRNVVLESGATVRALTYLVNAQHPQFAGRLDLRRQLELIRGSTGESGANTEYVRKTAQHLLSLGIRDGALLAIVDALGPDAPLLAQSA